MGKINSKFGESSLNNESKLERFPILKTLNMQKRVDQMLKLQDISTKTLQFVFQKNMASLITELDNISIAHKQKDGKNEMYEQILTITFWFAVHLENIQIARALLNKEQLIKQLVACALISENNKQQDDDESEDGEDYEEGSDDSFKSENLSEEIKKEQFKKKRHDLQKEGGSSEEDGSEESSFYADNDKYDDFELQKKKQEQEKLLEISKIQSVEQNEPPKQTLGQVLMELKRQKEQEEAAKNRSQNSSQNYQQKAQESSRQLKAIGITNEIIEKTKLDDMETLIKVKNAFRLKFQHLMKNILKIAFSNNEEKIACIITAYYEIDLEEEMIIRAIANDNYQWLKFVWAFGKNYIGTKNKEGALHLTFESLIDMIKKQYSNDQVLQEKVAIITNWHINSDDNILIALMAHNLDELAIKCMGYYSHLLDQYLFVFCVTHGNHYFLQRALLLAAFDKMIFREDAVINQILNILKEGYRTNYLMNILSLIDISVWKNKHLKELIEIINDYVEQNYDKNRLLLSPNPIMSIALAAEILNKIGESRKKFENECVKIRGQLLGLGKMYSSKIVDEKYYETLIMQEDFKGRTCLKIITQNQFEDLMDENDPKAENLMLMIWHGKEATRCDGNIYGYSNLSHIIMTKAKKISGKKTSLMQIITNYFEPNFKVDYSFQYRYRSKAISFYFKKEFICALVMLVIFQYINYRYLVLFSSSYLKTNDDPSDNGTLNDKTQKELNAIIKSIREYIDWNFWAVLFSAALLFQFILKILFNACSKSKISIDKWTIIDTLSAVLNILAVQIIQNIDPSDLLVPIKKDFVDYFMILVLVVSWLRFFCYFLVVHTISKLLLTLIAMIGDTLSFMFIVSCFILIMASIFTTLYQDVNPDRYGGLALTVRTLFDAALGEYAYDGMGGRELSHSILLVFHVFFANILLMNYLIAILSTTYDNMKETGIFKYKVNLYQYCERFMIAFNDRSYGEIVLHPPPLSYLSLLMIPFLTCRRLMMYISNGFSYFMFWMENILFISIFLGYEISIMPIAYIKVWFNIIRNSIGLMKMTSNSIVFAITGIIMMIIITFGDCCNLIKILCFHQGCRFGIKDELVEEEVDRAQKIKIYNEARATVISLYKRLKKHMKQDTESNSEDEEEDEDLLDESDFFHIKDDENMNEDFLYVVKKSLIIDEWKKRKAMIAKQEKIRQKQIEEEGEAGNSLRSIFVSSMRKKLTGQNSNVFRNDSGVFKNAAKKVGNLGAKPKDLANQMKVVFLEALRKSAQNFNDDDVVDMSDFEIPEIEIKLVDEFLTKFTIVSESSMNEHLDIMLMIKALPNQILDYTLEMAEQTNFRIFQESLIAFQNLDIVNAFEYFDDKNRERVQNVKEKLQNQKNSLSDVKDILELVKMKIERNEEFFSQNLPLSNHGDEPPKIDMQRVNLIGKK